MVKSKFDDKFVLNYFKLNIVISFIAYAYICKHLIQILYIICVYGMFQFIEIVGNLLICGYIYTSNFHLCI